MNTAKTQTDNLSVFDSTLSPSDDTRYRADTCNNSAAQTDSQTGYSEWLTTHH